MEEDHRKQEEEGPPCTNCRRPRSRAYSVTRRAAITTPLDIAHISNLRKLLENVLHQNNGGKKNGANQKRRRCRILEIQNANHRRAKGILRTRAEGDPRITRHVAAGLGTSCPDRTEVSRSSF